MLGIRHFNQRTWRTIGAGALVASAGMAWYAVGYGVLRDTVLLLAGWMSELPPDAAPEHSGYFLFLYWSFFALVLLISLYMALLDLRYIRLQYRAERRAIFERTLGDSEFRKSLVTPPKDDNQP